MFIISYKMMQEVVDDRGKPKQVFTDKQIKCALEFLEANEEIAKREAYNGEYTIEDDGQPEPEIVPTVEDRVEVLEETSATKDEVQAVWDSMAAAYNEGVQNA